MQKELPLINITNTHNYGVLLDPAEICEKLKRRKIIFNDALFATGKNETGKYKTANIVYSNVSIS